MHMTSLQELHRNMIAIRTDMQQFQINMGAASFDCLFSTRDAPFVLTLTSRGNAPKFFRFNVLPGYRIKDYLGEMYGPLLEVLRVNGATGQPLSPKPFLDQLNKAIPTHADLRNHPAPSEIIRLRPDIVEDRDRPFFDSWIYWDQTVSSPRGPSTQNLEKTRLMLGTDAERHSIETRASSKWSAVDLGRDWVSTSRRAVTG